MSFPLIANMFLILVLVASPSNTVSNGVFDLTVNLNSDKPATWFDSRQLDFTIIITNRGFDDKALNITYSLTRATNEDIIQSSSGSALVRAHQSYTYPLKIATFETGQLQLSVHATGVIGPVNVICEAQPSSVVSLGFLSGPLGIVSLPLSLFGFAVAIYGLRNDEDTWTICGALLAIVGVVMFIIFGQIWVSWVTQIISHNA